MTATSFAKMRRRSGYGLTRASGSCSALTLLLTSLGHDSGSASDSAPRRWHGGASLGLVLGSAVDTWSASGPGRFWMGSPHSPRTWKLDTTFMSPSYLAVAVHCLWLYSSWRNAWFNSGYMLRASSPGVFGRFSS